MYLITSAAFVASELKSEFGSLPPSFLPVGNQRLFHHQLALIPNGERILLTLPQGFRPCPYDSQALSDRCVEILYVPINLSLGESIVFALNLIEFDSKDSLFILHGDTLFSELPNLPDLLSVNHVEDNYDWAEYDAHTGLLYNNEPNEYPSSDMVVSGFFSFSAPKTLIRQIITANWDFIGGLNGYIKEIGLKPWCQNEWYDFGHCQTYYQSKTRITTQRAFNRMDINGKVVRKSSHKKFKLLAEVNWYENIPRQLRLYTPQLLDTFNSDTQFGYSIEYLHLTALNELYVFSQLPAFTWKKILKACCEFLLETVNYKAESKEVLDELFYGKTLVRLKEYSANSPFDIERPLFVNGKSQPSLMRLAQICKQYLPSDNSQINVLHGDFCFSNILYDFRTSSIKVIDPRGIDSNDKQSIYGNTLYDVAKLAHSVIGLYDYIISGYFRVSLTGYSLDFQVALAEHREEIVADFITLIDKYFGINEVQICAMQIQLFLSMLPLHNDKPERQLAFIGNAYRLYEKIKILTGNTQ